jgi:hypothetical protein
MAGGKTTKAKAATAASAKKPKGATPAGTGISSARGDIATRFKPGESGNPHGRGKGSRNKLSEAFIMQLHDSFERNGESVIEAVMLENPGEYLRIIASIVPKQFGIEEGTQNAFLDVWRAISEGRDGGVISPKL